MATAKDFKLTPQETEIYQSIKNVKGKEGIEVKLLREGFPNIIPQRFSIVLTTLVKKGAIYKVSYAHYSALKPR